MYLVQNHKLGGVLTGPYGIGKSMVLELLAQQVADTPGSSYAAIDYLPGHPLSFPRHLLRLIGQSELEAQLREPMDLVALLRENRSRLRHTALVIDEAQTIQDPDVYRLLHLLMNITLPGKNRTPSGPAFTLILSGNNDMTKLLSNDESLSQRLQMVWNLDPLSPTQIIEYVQHRIRVAGGDIWTFDPQALNVLKEIRGIPRILNNICDVALMLGYAANLPQITAPLMRQALDEAKPS